MHALPSRVRFFGFSCVPPTDAVDGARPGSPQPALILPRAQEARQGWTGKGRRVVSLLREGRGTAARALSAKCGCMQFIIRLVALPRHGAREKHKLKSEDIVLSAPDRTLPWLVRLPESARAAWTSLHWRPRPLSAPVPRKPYNFRVQLQLFRITSTLAPSALDALSPARVSSSVGGTRPPPSDSHSPRRWRLQASGLPAIPPLRPQRQERRAPHAERRVSCRGNQGCCRCRQFASRVLLGEHYPPLALIRAAVLVSRGATEVGETLAASRPWDRLGSIFILPGAQPAVRHPWRSCASVDGTSTRA